MTAKNQTHLEATIKSVCEFTGITKVDSDAVVEIEKITREILKRNIVFARKLAGHCGRSIVTVSDVTQSLYNLPDPINLKNTIIDTKKYGVDQLAPVNGLTGVFAPPNPEYDLNSLPGPSEPLMFEMRLKAHFLVTDGKIGKSKYNLTGTDGEDDEDDNTVYGDDEALEDTIDTNSSASLMYMEKTRNAKTEQMVGLKPSCVEILTVEQQLFIKDIITVCMGMDDKKRPEALQTLETDAGLQPLLPSLVHMVCKSIAANISQRCLSLIIYACRILRALCQNKAVDLSMMLHEILPVLMSCVVGRNICLRPDVDNHWALRDYANKTLAVIVKEQIKPNRVAEFRQRVFNFAYCVFKSELSSAPMIYGCTAVMVEFIEPEKYEWLVGQLREMFRRFKVQQDEFMSRASGGGLLIGTEVAKLCQALLKHEGGLRQKLGGGMPRQIIRY